MFSCQEDNWNNDMQKKKAIMQKETKTTMHRKWQQVQENKTRLGTQEQNSKTEIL